MPFLPGKETYVSVAANDLSTYIDSITYNLAGESYDVTAMGADWHAFIGGLKGGTLQISGGYNDAAMGPKALRALVSTSAAVVYRPEGTGSGLPEDTFSAIIVGYDETSPVAGRKEWASTMTFNGAVTSTTQAP